MADDAHGGLVNESAERGQAPGLIDLAAVDDSNDFSAFVLFVCDSALCIRQL